MSLESCGLAPLPGETRGAHKDRIRDAIQEWNANRLDLFEITAPNDDLEFFGAMRFYFQDSGAKMGTKCIRVSSTADARNVVDILIEKFRPDMKMLALPNYVLYEIHSNGFERMLAAEESPLLCQLAWNKDDREGRFLLKSANEKTQKWNDSFGESKDGDELAASGETPTPSTPEKEKKGTFARASKRFSKRAAKKKEKQKEKEMNEKNKDGEATTEDLYKSSFSRTISNPEMVMKRRRQLKLEKKLQEFKSKDGAPDRGGTLKIYGESLRSDVPYKTLLLSVTDDASWVVREILDKYGYENALAADYCLVQVQSPRPEDGKLGQTKATILEDQLCPLAILMSHPEDEGIITFHIQKKPDSLKKKPPTDSNLNVKSSHLDLLQQQQQQQQQQQPYPPSPTSKYGQMPDNFNNNNNPNARQQPPPSQQYPPQDELDAPPVGQRPVTTGQEKLLPFLQEVPPAGQHDPNHPPKGLLLQPNVTEVGSERSLATSGQYLQLFGPGIQPRHCVIAHTEGVVTATPCSIHAETFVNNVRIYETAMLQSGSLIRFGKMHTFQFIDPNVEELNKRRSDASSAANSAHNIGPYQHPPPPKPLIQQQQQQQQLPGTPTSPKPTNYETTFDVDGHVETSVTSSNTDLTKGDGGPIPRRGPAEGAPATSGGTPTTPTLAQANQQPYYPAPSPATVVAAPPGVAAAAVRPMMSIPGDGLPATLEFREDSEDKLLSIIIAEVNGAVLQFKLAPTYTQYLVLRRVLSPYYRPDMLPADRTIRVTNLTNKMVAKIHHTIVASQANAGALSFWMANASELLHFIKQDRDLSGMTADAQDTLAEAVQHAFRFLVHCMHAELNLHLPSILDPTDADIQQDELAAGGGSGDASSNVVATPVLQTLAAAMSLLRRCRVNAALTIQLFSQLFHYINMWIFNRLVSAPPPPAHRGSNGLCTQPWGARLMRRLARIAAWAEKQGLELAADCHLSRVLQAAYLLQQPKSPENITGITAECFKLNSLQLRALLENYSPTPQIGENWLPQEVIEHVVNIAQSTADELFASEGRALRCEEDPDLQLPFLLPEDGYSGDILRGVPNGFQEFLEPMMTSGLVRLTLHPNASGLWTVHMIGHPIPPEATPFPTAMQAPTPTPQQVIPPGNPVISTVTFQKTKGMGLSIVAAKGVGQDRLGIYIKSVVKGGAAHLDGRLQAGDQLLAVDGQSLIGVSQEKAAELMTQTGQMVTLDVAKGGAIFHGLAALLSQPSPLSGGPSAGNPPVSADGTPQPQGAPPPPNTNTTYQAPPSQQPPQATYGTLGGGGGPAAPGAAVAPAGPRRAVGPGSTLDKLRPKSELPVGAQTENGNPNYATLGRNRGGAGGHHGMQQQQPPGMAPAQSVATLHPVDPSAAFDANNPLRSKSTSNLAGPHMPIPAHLYPPGHPAALRPESEGEEDPSRQASHPPPDVVVSSSDAAGLHHLQHQQPEPIAAPPPPPMSVADNVGAMSTPYYEEHRPTPPLAAAPKAMNSDSPLGSQQLQLQDPPLRNPYATYHAQPAQAVVPEQPAGRVAPYGAPSSPYNSSPSQSPQVPSTPTSTQFNPIRGPAPPTPTRNPATSVGNSHPPLQRHHNSTSSPYYPPEALPQHQPTHSLPLPNAAAAAPPPQQQPPAMQPNVNENHPGMTPTKTKPKLTFEEERRKWLREEINNLESLEFRNEDQENKLKFLKLEEEFQKRLDQVKVHGDDDDEDDDDEDDDDELSDDEADKMKMEAQVRQQMMKAMNEIKEQQQEHLNVPTPPPASTTLPAKHEYQPHRYVAASPHLSPRQSPRNSMIAPGRNAPGAIKLGGLVAPPSQTPPPPPPQSSPPMEDPVTPPEEEEEENQPSPPPPPHMNALSRELNEKLRLDQEEMVKEERRKEMERIAAERDARIRADLEEQRRRVEEEEKRREEEERRRDEEDRLFEEEERKIREEEERRILEEQRRDQEAARQKAFEEAYINRANNHHNNGYAPPMPPSSLSEPVGIPNDQDALPPPPPEILHGSVSPPNHTWMPQPPPPDQFTIHSPNQYDDYSQQQRGPSADDYRYPPAQVPQQQPPPQPRIPPAVAPKPFAGPKRVSFAGGPPPPPPKPTSQGRPVSLPAVDSEMLPPQMPTYRVGPGNNAGAAANPAAKIGADMAPPQPLVGGAVNPRVVGAQEVYRDPRDKLLGQKVQNDTTTSGPDPDKLTFKEKMKRFALEAGEGQTPPHKAKASNAQRKLEGLASPLAQ